MLAFVKALKKVHRYFAVLDPGKLTTFGFLENIRLFVLRQMWVAAVM